MAAKAGYVEDIKEILSTGNGDWNVTDSLGNTPLHYAAGTNRKLVKLFPFLFYPHKNQLLFHFFNLTKKFPFFTLITKNFLSKIVL
jgi:hypothetical protein